MKSVAGGDLRSVLFACDLDSQVFGALPFARAFRDRGWRVVFAIHSWANLPFALAAALQEEFDALELDIARLALSDVGRRFDAVGVFAAGSKIHRFRRDLDMTTRALGVRRPMLFCGFNGVVLDRFEEGLSWRIGYDVICLNGPRDQALCDAFVRDTVYQAQRTVLTGLHRPVPRIERRQPGRPVLVFAEQVAIPDAVRERTYLFCLLRDLALANADWDVVVKARVRPHEKTFFKTTLHPEDHFNVPGNSAPNIRVTYDPMEELLAEAALLGTVSSTAVFDALSAQVPAFVVSDFGVRCEYGTHVFASSGLGVDLLGRSDLTQLTHLKPRAGWLSWIGHDGSCTAENLVNVLDGGTVDVTRSVPGYYDSNPMPLVSERLRVVGIEKPENRSPARKRPQNGPPQFGKLVQSAQTAMAEDRFDDALRDFKAALAANPESTNTMRALAGVYLSLGDRNAALHMLERATVLKPDNQNIRRQIRRLRSPLLRLLHR
ncbi:MAG: tetratricopeptide repeat protein [Polyangiaceae bacterium]|nr:tetratricopeptide repeat protein [Polyangiaceae bacterium]